MIETLLNVFLWIFCAAMLVSFVVIVVLMVRDYKQRKHQRTYLNEPRVRTPSKDCKRDYP